MPQRKKTPPQAKKDESHKDVALSMPMFRLITGQPMLRCTKTANALQILTVVEVVIVIKDTREERERVRAGAAAWQHCRTG